MHILLADSLYCDFGMHLRNVGLWYCKEIKEASFNSIVFPGRIYFILIVSFYPTHYGLKTRSEMYQDTLSLNSLF